MDKQSEDLTLTLRLPADVAEAMRQAAHEDDRSLNGEMVWAVRDYLARRKRAQEPWLRR